MTTPGHRWWAARAATPPSPSLAPEMQKTGARHSPSWPVSPVAPRSRGDHAKGRVRRPRARAALLALAEPIVTRGQALDGESSSVLTLWPGDVAPFLGLRFIASTATCIVLYCHPVPHVSLQRQDIVFSWPDVADHTSEHVFSPHSLLSSSSMSLSQTGTPSSSFRIP
jgi:hypothetical protein